MATRLNIFYSWQSDAPSNLNKDFIESALNAALKRLKSDAELEKALRDTTIELDKDVQGVSGSPPIVDTILKKIQDCAVFVADLSFIGKSKSVLASRSGNSRQIPNPNVLIEYGYALRCHTHSKVVSIMNEAYGTPDNESLPFDLRHLQWPIRYKLGDESAADKGDQFESLVGKLIEAIGQILKHLPAPDSLGEEFTPRTATKNAAVFFGSADDLVGDAPNRLIMPDGAKAYLRLYPSTAVDPFEMELDAQDCARGVGLLR